MPKPAKSAAWSFQKFNKRAIDFAMVGVAVQGTSVALSTWARPRCGPPPWSPPSPAARRPPKPAARAAEGTNAGSDIHASKAYREHLARVLVRRALEEASARA